MCGGCGDVCVCVEGCGDVGAHDTVCVEGCGDVGVHETVCVVVW